MAELCPYPLAALTRRMLRELESRDSIFDLPRRKFFLGDPEVDFSVRFHGQPASTPFGPAAGPHSQLAQNIVLSWLAGGRIMELKTVQVLDELKIPRPCIDMQTVGYNVEWSQELKLEQSLEEYVKAAMLIEVLKAHLDVRNEVIYDMSVGYDLAGIQNPRVEAFLTGMKDAGPVIDRLRPQLPKAYRDLDFPRQLSRTLTLSTFHGCPPDEIERILEFLMQHHGLHCVVKLNPTLLGQAEVKRLLNDQLGYEATVPESAFQKDTRWDQAVAFSERLSERAHQLGLSFGVKFSNTLIVNNQRDFFPATEKEMYLSGRPLHVLAMCLVRDWRRHFGQRLPISFAAGIGRKNYPDAVALGLTPVTVCSDLLGPGGYGRAQGYHLELKSRMQKVGAGNIDEFILRSYGLAEAESPLAYPEWVAQTALRNTEHYLEQLLADPSYHHSANSKPPKKVGSRLVLFDCLTCDKCIPVCPNDANFTFVLPRQPVPRQLLERHGSGWKLTEQMPIPVEQKHQLANFADFCNECGNCDIFCPEDGGPYAIKPRFFGSLESFERFTDHDGFYLTTTTVWARFEGREYRLALGHPPTYAGPTFEVSFDPDNPAATVTGRAEGVIDLTYYHLMLRLHQAVFATDTVNYINCLEEAPC
ncbi:MAG: glutamate synthase [Vulcanimicrobiota bacterium]